MGTVGTLLAVNWVEPGDKKRGRKERFTQKFTRFGFILYLYLFF